MFSVALIGPDGAGKSTIAEMLASSFPVAVKVLYMGINLESSNVMLPTSRLIRRLKRLSMRKSGAAELRNGVQVKRKPSGRARALVRTINRLAEEWYRQLVLWKYQRDGAIVICDRHFQFDFDYGIPGPTGTPDPRVSERFHRWCLRNLYPSPDLTIFLDAPGEVLHARKGEATAEWLESRRQALLRQGARIPNFIRIDSTKPLAAVYEDVSRHILVFYEKNYSPQRIISQAA